MQENLKYGKNQKEKIMTITIKALEEKYADEWKVVGSYVSTMFKGEEPKRNFPISEKENIVKVLKGEKPMYLPDMTGMTALSPRVIKDHVVRSFVMEAEPMVCVAEGAGGKDMFGVEWEFIPVTGGAMVKPGNPLIPDITKWEEYVTFPDISTFGWEESAEKNAHIFSDDRLVRTWIMNGLNERIISFMDFDKVMIAYVDEDEKEGVHRLFDRLCDFYDELIDYLHRYLRTDVIMFNDDWGTQRAPQFSNATAREMLVPYIRRIVESCHKRGMYFELHSCGKNESLVPVFIEAGIDIWAPQEVINDFDVIFETASDDILIGIPTTTSPKNTDEEAFEIAKEYVEKYAKAGKKVMLNLTFPVQHPRTAEFVYYLSREKFAE